MRSLRADTASQAPASGWTASALSNDGFRSKIRACNARQAVMSQLLARGAMTCLHDAQDAY